VPGSGLSQPGTGTIASGHILVSTVYPHPTQSRYVPYPGRYRSFE